MSNIIKKLLPFALIMCPAMSAGVVFSLDPVGGAISAYAGQADAGWGFTFSNDSDFALVTSADFLTNTPLGTFSDFISSYQFVVAGPSPETNIVTQIYELTQHTGAGQFFADPNSVIGAHSDGIIRLTYDLYSVSPNDPLFDAGAHLISSGNIISALASVDIVDAPASADVPEPASLGYIASCLMLCLGIARYRVSSRACAKEAPALTKSP